MKSYIKCVNVDYESSRIEEFNGKFTMVKSVASWHSCYITDIQLNVKGMKNLYESFMDYVAVETLEGENKYQAEGLGLQDAKKGIIFESFPPVLHLQLKRFEYDIQRDAMVKVRIFSPSLSSFKDFHVLITYSRSTIVTNSPLRSISASFSMTMLIDQSHGCTSCTVY
jgi:ubiquitin C-terminal hydrolase